MVFATNGSRLLLLGILLLSAACGSEATRKASGPHEEVNDATAGHDTDRAKAADSPIVQEGNGEVEHVYLSASWAQSYSSIEPMARESDMVVVGTVTGVGGVTVDSRKAGSVTASLVFTDFQFAVEETFKGSAGSSTILIHQTGGRDGATILEVHDDPLLEVGVRYLLFLRKLSPGQYAVKAGPVGRMLVDGGQVFSLSARYPDRAISDLGIRGQAVSQVKDAVAAAAR